MTAPIRVQLKRTKGWRMPPNTVKVDRTTKWGNPYKVGDRDHNNDLIETPADAANAFGSRIDTMRDGQSQGWDMPYLDDAKAALRGRNLACWCKIGTPCHADVLLEIANP